MLFATSCVNVPEIVNVVIFHRSLVLQDLVMDALCDITKGSYPLFCHLCSIFFYFLLNTEYCQVSSGSWTKSNIFSVVLA